MWRSHSTRLAAAKERPPREREKTTQGTQWLGRFTSTSPVTIRPGAWRVDTFLGFVFFYYYYYFFWDNCIVPEVSSSLPWHLPRLVQCSRQDTFWFLASSLKATGTWRTLSPFKWLRKWFLQMFHSHKACIPLLSASDDSFLHTYCQASVTAPHNLGMVCNRTLFNVPVPVFKEMEITLKSWGSHVHHSYSAPPHCLCCDSRLAAKAVLAIPLIPHQRKRVCCSLY